MWADCKHRYGLLGKVYLTAGGAVERLAAARTLMPTSLRLCACAWGG